MPFNLHHTFAEYLLRKRYYREYQSYCSQGMHSGKKSCANLLLGWYDKVSSKWKQEKKEKCTARRDSLRFSLSLSLDSYEPCFTPCSPIIIIMNLCKTKILSQPRETARVRCVGRRRKKILRDEGRIRVFFLAITIFQISRKTLKRIFCATVFGYSPQPCNKLY